MFVDLNGIWIDPEIVNDIIDLACLSPSVGNSQPWRFVMVDEPARRARILDSFRRTNVAARATYSGKRADLYASLKLAGLSEAPCQIAVFVDETTTAGLGLGRRTMPETLHYSAVAAVQTLWLAARAHGLGVGWVSILEPEEAVQALDVPDDWTLVAYLCVGYPEEEHLGRRQGALRCSAEERRGHGRRRLPDRRAHPKCWRPRHGATRGLRRRPVPVGGQAVSVIN